MKDLFWLRTEIKTPPFSEEARIEAGTLLRRLQYGEILSMPHAKPMSDIGDSCFELRIKDGKNSLQWRIIYHIATDAIVVLYSFPKKTEKTPQAVLTSCRNRLKEYYRIINEG